MAGSLLNPSTNLVLLPVHPLNPSGGYERRPDQCMLSPLHTHAQVAVRATPHPSGTMCQECNDWQEAHRHGKGRGVCYDYRDSNRRSCERPRSISGGALVTGNESGRIWAEIQASSNLEHRWAETTPWVLVKVKERDRTRIRLSRLGYVNAYEFTVPGPRGGKGKARKTLHLGVGYDWKQVDVRVADEALMAEVRRIDAEVKHMQAEKDALLKERFLELPLLDFEDVQRAREPWRRLHLAMEAFRKGEATEEYVRQVMREVLTDAWDPMGGA